MDQNIQKHFKTFITNKGLKASRQRDSILDIFLSTGFQGSADDLFIRLRKSVPTLGRATVYRTLKLLTASGIAVATNNQGSTITYSKNSD